MLLEQEHSNHRQRRELGNEQDLELAYDQNYEIQDKDLHDKVLFAVQGLGSVRTVRQGDKYIEAYIKGPHCQDSIKDLVKFIRNDVPDNPKVKMILSNYNIVETDLVQLLLLQVEDKKLSFWIIALLALITSKPSDQLTIDDKEKLFKALRDYKRSFVKHECLTILTIHIADYFKTQSKQKAHYQLLEFIILLIRNLLEIPDSPSDNQALHNHFLTTLIREEMFNPLLYLVQNEKSEIMSKIDVPLMEIFYYTFTCFDPDLLYKKDAKGISFQKIALQNKANRGPTPLRHSRFLPNFMIKSDVGISRITHRLDGNTEPIKNQRQVPRRTADLKKVEKIQREHFGENFMELEFQVHDAELGGTVVRKVGQLVFQISQEFVEVELPMISELVFSQVYKETAKITTQNVIQYLLLCNWAAKMTRAKYLMQKSQVSIILIQAKNPADAEQVEFDLAQIAHIMQTAHFQLIYKLLFREATREKRKDFKINTFNAGLKLFQSYLNVIQDISLSFRPSDRNNANVLMANMFRHDIARIFKIGFMQVTHEGILKTLISVCHKFYKLLSRYSNGKVLTIQTNKLLKRKNKKIRPEEEQLADFISEDSEDDEDGEKSYHEGEEADRKKQKPKKAKRQEKEEVEQQEEPMFQERKFNQISQFAIIAEYDIISKYMMFLKEGRVKGNSEEFNESIFFYFEQICKLLKGEWLFFQAESLIVFQQILSQSSELIQKNRAKWQDRIKFVKNVCRQFIKLMQKNKLALVESLFHYPNLSLKEKILKNYDDGEYGGNEEMEQNMFVDKDDDE